MLQKANQFQKAILLGECNKKNISSSGSINATKKNEKEE